jgi:serine/threonine protein kinase
VDWGLAKVLPRLELGDNGATTIQTLRSNLGVDRATSKVGSLMGTIPYLSPEQAKGQIDRIDEHADVFSLGAILCEILTGAPPYRGDPEAVLIGAASGSLDDAHARLAACGAEEEIVDLARECLSKAIESRPRDAQAVSHRLSEFLARVERRARNAAQEIDQARVAMARAVLVRNIAIGVAVASAAAAAWFALR